MEERFDVVGLGCCAVDDLLYVERYPPADAKTPVRRRERQCGGLTATALVAAARLGARCAYGGVLGDGELSRFVLDRLNAEKIDTSTAIIRSGAGPIHSTIIVDETNHTRNIFPDLSVWRGLGGETREPLVRRARVLFVDHVDAEGMIPPAKVAREANIPVVGDLESDRSPKFVELMPLVDHLIVSEDFARKLIGRPDPAALWSDHRAAVVVTGGAQGCWWVDRDHRVAQHQPAFKVQVIDTTGCGDVFHGAYAAALAQGLPMIQRLRLASAAAAMKATRPGGQAGIPSRVTVEQFLTQNST